MIKLIQILAVFIILENLRTNSDVNPLTGLFPTTGTSLTISASNMMLIVYSVPTSYTNSITKASFNGANYSINLGFNLISIIPISSANSVVSFSFGTSSFNLGNLTLTITATQTATFTISNCLPIPQLIGNSLIPTSCMSLQNESYQLSISGVTQTTNGWSTTGGGTSFSTANFGMMTFFINLLYFPTSQSNLNASINVDFIKIGFTQNGATSSYFGVYNDQFGVMQCPQNCLACNQNLACTTCLGNFVLSGKTCVCPGTLFPYISPDLNPYKIETTTSNYYYSSASCILTTQYNSAMLSDQSCLITLQNLLTTSTVNLTATSGLLPQRLNLMLTPADPTILQSVSSTCLASAYLVNILPVGTNNVNSTLWMSTGVEAPVVFNSQILVDFGTYQYCNSTLISAFSINSLQCNLFSSFVQLGSVYNTTIVTFNNLYMKLSSSTANKVFFLPVYQLNPNLTMTKTGLISVIVCQDTGCLNPLTTNLIFQETQLVLKFVFLDPIFNYFNPNVYANMFVNGEAYNLLIISSAVEAQLMYTDYSLTISLASSEISSPATVQIVLSYGLVTPIAYNQTVSVTFQVILGNNANGPAVTFVKSFGFIVIMITLGILALGTVLGLMGFCISKCLKFEVKKTLINKVDQSNRNQRVFDMSLSDQNDNEEYQVENDSANPQKEIKAEDIYSKLLRR